MSVRFRVRLQCSRTRERAVVHDAPSPMQLRALVHVRTGFIVLVIVLMLVIDRAGLSSRRNSARNTDSRTFQSDSAALKTEFRTLKTEFRMFESGI